jgi:hypothetical protein
MRATNLYNGEVVVGCRFTFTLPVDIVARAELTSLLGAHAASPANNLSATANTSLTP